MNSRVEPELAEWQGLSHKLSESIQVRHLARTSWRGHCSSGGLADESWTCVDASADPSDIGGSDAIDGAGRNVRSPSPPLAERRRRTELILDGSNDGVIGAARRVRSRSRLDEMIKSDSPNQPGDDGRETQHLHAQLSGGKQANESKRMDGQIVDQKKRELAQTVSLLVCN
jgi:hypothetical protein